MKRRASEHLYAMAGHGWVKVGITCDVANRRRSNEQSCGQTRVVKSWHVGRLARKLERDVVAALTGSCIRGREFFNVSADVLVAEIEKAIAALDVKATARAHSQTSSYERAWQLVGIEAERIGEKVIRRCLP